MKIAISFTIIFLLFTNKYIAAQQLQGKVVAPAGRKDFKEMSVVDSSSIRISYAFNAENIHEPNSYIDLQYLEIGKYISKYYSYFVFNNDSLIWDWQNKHPNAQSIPRKIGILGRMPYYWSEYKYSEFFKDYKRSVLTEYARMPQQSKIPNCMYLEDMPEQDWRILEDTLTINSYLCQKAMCHFRGRDYIAWFAIDIPINNGPWKFGGLPGLILKVYDSQRLYTFECIKVENGKFPIMKYRFKNYKPTERNKLLRLQRKINENFYQTAGLIPFGRGKAPAPTSYEPLELE